MSKEQLIPKSISQAAQGGGDSRLRHAQTLASFHGRMLAQEFADLASASQSPVEVTCLACGPAREVQDFLTASAGPDSEEDGCPEAVHFHLVDHDEGALALVDEWSQASKAGSTSTDTTIDLHQNNAAFLCLGKEKLDLPPQDMVYRYVWRFCFQDTLILIRSGHSSLTFAIIFW